MATTLPPFASTSKHAPPIFPPPDPRPDCDYDIELVAYRGEQDLGFITALIEKELSEPYLIYTYRYFLNEWPHLTCLAYLIPRARRLPLPPRLDTDAATLGAQIDVIALDSKDSHPVAGHDAMEAHAAILKRAPVGVIVNKMDRHLKGDRLMRGYIAMLSIHPQWRHRGIARKLVQDTIDRMSRDGAQEIVLETEVDNSGALTLYESLGFIREKRLYRFYLNAKDSFRLVLPLIKESDADSEERLHRPDSGTEADRPSTPPNREQARPGRPPRPPTSPWQNQVYDFDNLIM